MKTNNNQFHELEKDIIVFHNKNEIPHISIPHLHSQYEINYNISGAKGFMIGGEVYECSKRNLILIPKVQTHKVVVKQNEPYERCIINIDEYVAELISAMCDISSMQWIFGGAAMVDLSEEEHDVFMALIHDYNRLENEKDSLLAFSKLMEMMSFLRRMFEKPHKQRRLENDMISHTDLVLKCVEQRFNRVSVGEIAKELYINEDHMNRVFKEDTGITIKQYLTLRKIAEAKKHLYLGKSVKEACILSGFGNYANFLRTFKNYEGYSPGKLKELTQPL
ncbi:MAG: AraC family transcriptional regulator [Clostridia bacterium]|nr:AraC family transcriptional regulator [Clostridia bacterium]